MHATDKISFRLILIFVIVTSSLVTLFGVVNYFSTKSSMEKQLAD